MTDHPMLFSAPMIRALLDRRKSQTRRILKLPTKGEYIRADMGGWAASTIGGRGVFFRDGPPAPERPCVWNQTTGTTVVPPYAPGDRIWVKETFADVNSELGPSLLYRADEHLVGWEDFSTTFGEDYGAGPSMDYDAYPGRYTMWWSDLLSGAPNHSWRPSIHMPRWASRLTLTITDVRVQRLMEISEEDAVAEGMKWPGYEGKIDPAISPRDQYRRLWDSLNAKRAPWADNPWVAAITFTVEQRNIDAEHTARAASSDGAAA